VETLCRLNGLNQTAEDNVQDEEETKEKVERNFRARKRY
jgi:hypothetical protein